jgi:hypothetical protein
LRWFIKAASYGQILFHKKNEIKEGWVELDVNSLYVTAMTSLRIPKGKPKEVVITTELQGTMIIQLSSQKYA